MSESAGAPLCASGWRAAGRAHGLWCVPDIMVQEFVEFGALDLYLKRGRSVSVSWKLDVAKQLASVLAFLVSWGPWRFDNKPASSAAETHFLLVKSNVCLGI